MTDLLGVSAERGPEAISDLGRSILAATTAASARALLGAAASEPFPVGSIYINVTGVNPATELGYGTWSAFGAGRVMVGKNAADVDFDVLEETGGAKTVAAAGTNSAPTFAGAALATHTHSVTSAVSVDDHPVEAVSAAGLDLAVGPGNDHNVTNNPATSSATSGGTPAGTVSAPTFTGSATSVVQPYIVVAAWKRTA